MKRGYLDLDADYRLLFWLLAGAWALSSALAGKFKNRRPETFMVGLGGILRAYLYFLVFLFVGLYVFQLFGYSRFIILLTVGLYLALETGGFWVVYILKWGPNVADEGSDFEGLKDQAEEVLKQEKVVLIDRPEREVRDPFREKLKEKYLKDKEEIFQFIDETIRLDKISTGDALMLSAGSKDTVRDILGHEFEFIANLSLLNNLGRINKFLKAVNEKLAWGGYFVGVAETLEQRFRRKFSRHPKFIRGWLYLIDFFWSRVCPKLSFMKKVYFFLHGKGMRAVSQTEILGRLHFCGFNVVKLREIDNLLYFIVKKVRPALQFNVTSWGFLFKQKRVGKNGNLIYIYKFRTMHPYSEYLHKYMYDKNIQENSKKNDEDFRITEWGHLLRKYWIDELPMIINWLQGDLKLVGVRPISEKFFIKWPEDLKKERTRYKPGLIPPYYADMTYSTKSNSRLSSDFHPGVWESERKYLEEYRQKPFLTDVRYFFKVFYNILFKGARSG